MSRTRTVVRGGVLSGGGVFFSMAALLLVGKMFTNALDQTSVAVFTLLLLWADFLNLFGNLGLAVSLPKLVAAADGDRRKAIIGAGLTFQLLIAGALSGLILLFWYYVAPPEAWLSHSDWAALYRLLWLLPPLFVTGVFRDTAMAGLAGLNRYGHRAAGIIASGMSQVVFVYLLVWVMRGGIIALTLATAAAYAVAVAWLVAALPRGARFRWDWPTYFQSVRFSLPLYINSLLNFVLQRFDTMLILLVLQSPETVAIYEMAKRLPVILSRGLGALLVPFLPNIAELISLKRRDKAAEFLSSTALYTAFIGYTLVLGVVLVQEPLLVLLFNENYLPATAVLGLLMTAICLAVQTGLMGQSLIALGRPGLVTLVNIAVAVVSVAANFVLLPRLGIAGAGVAALLAVALGNALQTGLVYRHGLRLDLRRYLFAQSFMALSGGLILLGGAGMIWRAAALMLFPVLCLLTGVVTFRQIRELLAATLGRR